MTEENFFERMKRVGWEECAKALLDRFGDQATRNVVQSAYDFGFKLGFDTAKEMVRVINEYELCHLDGDVNNNGPSNLEVVKKKE